jgi:hypothetical protein
MTFSLQFALFILNFLVWICLFSSNLPFLFRTFSSKLDFFVRIWPFPCKLTLSFKFDLMSKFDPFVQIWLLNCLNLTIFFRFELNFYFTFLVQIQPRPTANAKVFFLFHCRRRQKARVSCKSYQLSPISVNKDRICQSGAPLRCSFLG